MCLAALLLGVSCFGLARAMLHVQFIRPVLRVGKEKKRVIGIKTSTADVELVKGVVKRLEEEGVENVEITKEEAKALYKVLYGKYNFTTTDFEFSQWFEKQKNWTAEERKRIFGSVRDLIQLDGIKTATMAIVIVACVLVFSVLLVGTLVSNISPFTRVNTLTAKCG